MAKFVTGLILFVSLLGCHQSPVRHVAESPSVTVAPQTGQVEIKGDSATSPNVNTKQSGSKFALPEGSKLEFNDKLGTLTIVLSKASEIAVSRLETAIQGPTSFTPDKAPTIAEEKEAQADFWIKLGMQVGMVLGAGVGIFGLVRAWDFVMYGGFAVSAACMFGLFVQKHPMLLMLIGLGVAAIIIGPTIYHTQIKPLLKKDDV